METSLITLADNQISEMTARPNPMAPAIATAPLTPKVEDAKLESSRPESIPEKFWNPTTQSIRIDALLKSYLHLERKLARMVDTADQQAIDKARGVPEIANDYKVEISHELFTEDKALNEVLRQNGFTQDQVQLVYDLAAEKMIPMVLEMAEEFEADRQIERLIAQFGGEEKWKDVSRQLLAFGQKALPNDVLSSLAATYEGVMALYRMMEADEPLALRAPIADVPGDQDEIESLMNDPKYWRDRDPTVINRVTAGFKRLYKNN